MRAVSVWKCGRRFSEETAVGRGLTNERPIFIIESKVDALCGRVAEFSVVT